MNTADLEYARSSSPVPRPSSFSIHQQTLTMNSPGPILHNDVPGGNDLAPNQQDDGVASVLIGEVIGASSGAGEESACENISLAFM